MRGVDRVRITVVAGIRFKKRIVVKVINRRRRRTVIPARELRVGLIPGICFERFLRRTELNHVFDHRFIRALFFEPDNIPGGQGKP